MSKTEGVVVNKWSISSVKNALDDATKEILSENYGLVECHWLFDCRLVLCTLSVLVAGVALGWDYLYPHPQSRTVLFICIVLYFILSGIITLYVMFIEKNIFFCGKKLDPTGLDPPTIWRVSSVMHKNDPTYRLSFSVTDGKTGNVRQSSVQRCISDFFDIKGRFRNDLYSALLLKLVSDLEPGKKDQ